MKALNTFLIKVDPNIDFKVVTVGGVNSEHINAQGAKVGDVVMAVFGLRNDADNSLVNGLEGVVSVDGQIQFVATATAAHPDKDGLFSVILYRIAGEYIG